MSAEIPLHLLDHLRNLSDVLGEPFGKGMSVANLKNLRRFYLTFPDTRKSYAVRSELSWTHWRLVMRVENPDARDNYIEETAHQQWSSHALEGAIGTCSYARFFPGFHPDGAITP